MKVVKAAAVQPSPVLYSRDGTPVTLFIDERADGVHLSYDSMASLIAPHGSEAAR